MEPHKKTDNYTGANYRNNGDFININARECKERPKTKLSVIIVISVLLIVITLLGSVLAVMIFTKDDTKESSEANKTVSETEMLRMYVDCDVDIPFKESAEADSVAICTIPVGSAVEAYDEEKNGHTKIKYNEKDGYIESQYLCETCPFVWNYKDDEVEKFVVDVLYGYTNSITTGDITYLTDYLTGKAIQDAYDTHERVSSLVDREEIINVECQNVTRISKTRVTVERTSIIRMYYYDGRITDVNEKYLTTVEKTENNGSMKVIDFSIME